MNLKDSFGRRFPYLRLSITDVCNFRCVYCLPKGYLKTGDTEFLCLDEIVRLVRTFARLGAVKIRLTGGEPTVRKDLVEIIKAIGHIPTIQKIALTTNGYNLKSEVINFINAGITSLNVSVDSLQKDRFKEITGHDKLNDILDGLEIARSKGFESIKINTVLLKTMNQSDVNLFFDWIKINPYQVRFIELMETGENKIFFKEQHVRAQEIINQLMNLGFSEQSRNFTDGPSRVFKHIDYSGSIGIIAPYANDFCATCNRLRVTAKGHLKLCLFGDSSYDLRPYLQSDQDQQNLEEKILDLLMLKQQTHNLHNKDTGMTPHLASVGG